MINAAQTLQPVDTLNGNIFKLLIDHVFNKRLGEKLFEGTLS